MVDPVHSAIGTIRVGSRKLWFGAAAGVASWLLLGVLDVVLAWGFCTRQQDYGVPPEHTGLRIAIVLIALMSLSTAIAAGIVSYRNWRAIAGASRMLEADAEDAREFLAMVGVIISITLGAGIVWLSLPPLFVELCWRAR